MAALKFTLAVLTAAIAACGGGGDAPVAAPPVSPVPAPAPAPAPDPLPSTPPTP